MRSLSDHDIVKLWEVGQNQHPLDRALTFLAFAYPERSLISLANLTIGQRDALLLILREQTFGPTLDSVASCPKCQEQLEFSLKTYDICFTDIQNVMECHAALPENASGGDRPSNLSPSHLSPSDIPIETYRWNLNDLTLQFRLPNSLDWAAVMMMAQPEHIWENLARRCLLTIKRNADEVTRDQLGDGAIATFAEHLAQADPQAEILLDLQCPACQHDWQMVFDIVSYLWAEISSYAKRLLIDVHQLAQVYGWSESDILAMAKQRRQYYLELVA